MRALMASGYGPPSGLALGEARRPEPGANQVLVQMRAAALNPFDLKLLSGAMREFVPVEFPYVPGMDGAGTVVALGEGVEGVEAAEGAEGAEAGGAEGAEGVEGVAVGDEVLGFFGRTPGTLAEYAVLDVGCLTKRPPALDAVRAAALPESGVTAKTLLRAVAPVAGESLLVVGATGGIGMFVVALAAAAGVEVLATASPAEAEYVKGLGAAAALDYTAADTAELALARHPEGVDAVIDVVNSGEAVLDSARALREGGRFASPLSGPADLDAARAGVAASYVSLTLLPGDLADLAARAAEGRLRVEVSRVYEFEQAGQAFVDFASGHTRGKLVVSVRE
jgi:NADPH:quinone reductase-like Zn-dependent oxidoreductase